LRKGKLKSWFGAFFLVAFLAFVGGGNSAYNKINKLISDSEESEIVIESEEKSKFSDDSLKFNDDHGSAILLLVSSYSKNLFIHSLAYRVYVFVEVTARLYLLHLALKLDC
jgi:hypothetical protein